MGKYSQKLCDKIAALIEEDNFTVTQICEIVGISRKVFYEWKASKPEFAEALEQAEEAREEQLKQKARQALRKKIEGYKQVETKTTYVPAKDSDDPNALEVKQVVVTEKICLPDTRAIAHVLGETKKQTNTQQAADNNNYEPMQFIVDSEDTKRELEKLRDNLRNEVY